MKRSVLIFAIILAGLGGTISVIDAVMATSERYPFSFEFGMLCNAPAGMVASLFGTQNSADRGQWVAMEIGVNTILCFVVGALIGALVHLFGSFLRGVRNDHQHETRIV